MKKLDPDPDKKNSYRSETLLKKLVLIIILVFSPLGSGMLLQIRIRIDQDYFGGKGLDHHENSDLG